MATRDGLRFDYLCTVSGLPAPVPEYAFATALGRRWRFDWAWVGAKVALEVEGALMGAGRHVRPSGLRSDMEKYNTAQVLGWMVLRCMPETLTRESTLDLVRQALDARA